MAPDNSVLLPWRGEGNGSLMPEYLCFHHILSQSDDVIPSFLRSSVALHAELDALEDLGNYLRTVSLEVDPTYREKDGIVGRLSA